MLNGGDHIMETLEETINKQERPATVRLHCNQDSIVATMDYDLKGKLIKKGTQFGLQVEIEKELKVSGEPISKREIAKISDKIAEIHIQSMSSQSEEDVTGRFELRKSAKESGMVWIVAKENIPGHLPNRICFEVVYHISLQNVTYLSCQGEVKFPGGRGITRQCTTMFRPQFLQLKYHLVNGEIVEQSAIQEDVDENYADKLFSNKYILVNHGKCTDIIPTEKIARVEVSMIESIIK